MKIAKILSAAVAAVAASAAVAATASATMTVVSNPNPGLTTATGMWMVQLYNEGNEAENKPATNYGIDLTSIASFSITVTPAEPDWWDGTFGGSFITSCGPASATPADHNWPTNEFWGVNDPELEIDTQTDAGKPYIFEKTGDLTYTGTITLDDRNCLYDVTSVEGGYAQIGMQEWGSTMTDMTVLDLTCYDAAGNVIISFDADGNVDSDLATAPADDAAADDTTAATADAEAPADTTTTAPSKGSPDTGVEGVAAVAGVAVVAAGAVVLSKKRK